jgi:hypothetical protein
MMISISKTPPGNSILSPINNDARATSYRMHHRQELFMELYFWQIGATSAFNGVFCF